MICRALAGTLTWLQAADILGIHPRSLCRWRARYQAGEPLKKVRGVGNAAGAGARLALASRAYLRKAEEIQRQAEYVELAGHDDFMEVFVEAMNFPLKSPPM